MCRRRRRTSCSLSSFLVFFFFLRARNFISELVDGAVGDAVGNAGHGCGGDGAAGRAAVLKRAEVDGGVAAEGDAAIVDVPLLGAQRADELLVMGNEDDTTLELANGDGETAEGVTVQEVSRLVEHQQMGVVPHGTGDDNLDLLTTRQRANLVVVGNLGVEAEVLKVLGDDSGLELTVTETLARRLVVVELLDELGETPLNHGLAGDLGVVLGEVATPFAASGQGWCLHFVLECLLVLLTTDNGLNLARRLAVLEVDELVHLLAVLLGEHTGLLHMDLAIVTVGVTPLEVLVGRLLEMHLHVLKSVLLDVTDTQVGVLLYLTGAGDDLTSKNLDEGGLASTVGADDGHSGRQSELAGDVAQRRLGSLGVLVGNVGHADDGTGQRLDTSQDTRRRELELDLGGRERVVALGLGAELDEVGQVALVARQLLVGLVVVDVGGDVVEETRVVGNDQAGNLGVGLEVGLEPGNVGNIQVVSRFVEQQDVGTLEHGTSQGQLHLPSTRQGANLVGLAAVRAVGETELDENLHNLLTATGGDLRVLQDEVQNANVSILALVVLDVDGAEDVLRREALQLAVGNAAHQRGLAGTVATAKTVTVTLEQSQGSVGQQQHTAVGQGEVGVDDLGLAVVLLLRNTVLAFILLNVVLLNTLGDGSVGAGVLQQRLQVRSDSAGDALNKTVVDILGNLLGDVGTGQLETIGVCQAAVLLDLGIENLANVVAGDTLDDILVVAHGLLDDVQRSLGQLADLGEGGAVVDTLNTRLQLGQEGSGLDGVVDQLCQVLDDNNCLTKHLLGGGGGVEGTLQKGSQESQDGGGDDGNKGGHGQGVDGLAQGLGRGVVHGLDEEGNARSDIVVGQDTSEGGHGLDGLLLDLGLEVVHAALDEGNEASQLGSHGLAEDVLLFGLLLGRADGLLGLFGDLLEEEERSGGSLPLSSLLGEVGVEDGEEANDESLRAQVVEESVQRVLGGLADDGALVGERIEGAGNHAAILEQEDELTQRRLGRQTLKERAEQVLRRLAQLAGLLVGGGLLDLGEDSILMQTSVSDRVVQDFAETVCGIDRGGGGGGCEDRVQEGGNILLGWRGRGIALGHDGHRRLLFLLR
ncbi:uncharacterized protein ColSpa_03000 [Colletotrichum spaethianum]|uniref:NAD-specific glutamate dehydrogenase n=1 Tax=Colletotrichum spaethianum TaxID=700344 RepID=A0AA37NZY5_9PEZI|nr:uncharacterized protein ColSpa_03000 [Colletotrichum spaethianum]GKT42818.1 hypothetical protein ColSpa_03000 [Colletotrichum spaethianum]